MTYYGVFKMKRIMLCCSAGMSTSLLMRKMKEVADARGLDVEIAAYAAHEFDEQVGKYDVVLLGPQVKYMLASFKEKAEGKGVPVAAIDMMDYGMQRGDNVLDFAFSLIETSGQPL
ncbi:Cellobiose-specific phosphotransferase enzyme IIB component [Pectobacterium wasabiae CFBP 3304]|nr:Cellobiose-specific phosphotransferase enzyme IIB component [Pectobacterium wasabiae CFBP 3304]